MEVLAKDISILLYVPDDGSESNAVKVVHRTSQTTVINEDTISQRHNLRSALSQLIASINPNPERIRRPILLPFDRVQVKLVKTVHEGEVIKLSWDFKRDEWEYFVDCRNDVISKWYLEADLVLLSV